jgi:hypothetical protein
MVYAWSVKLCVPWWSDIKWQDFLIYDARLVVLINEVSVSSETSVYRLFCYMVLPNLG